MRKKRTFFLLSILLIIFCTLNLNFAVAADSQVRIDLYGFGDHYEGGGVLALDNERTCYVSLHNIPVSEKENIILTVEDNNIAEIKQVAYGASNPVISATIKGKKLGSTRIIASLMYNGVNYTSEIFTTVHVSAYSLELFAKDSTDSDLKVGDKIQLTAMFRMNGSSLLPRDVTTDGVTWTSSNENIANVDNKGLVTAIGKGITTIAAKYTTDEGTTITTLYALEVKDEKSDARINFYLYEPGPVMVLNREEEFSIELYNIPSTEKENIKFKIENENIAEITKTEYGKGGRAATATVKFLSLGKTKLIATLNYNGEVYSASYDLNAMETNKCLELYAKGYADLPTSFKVGEKLQLTATLRNRVGALEERDVTSNGTIWTSSNAKIADVDNNGMVTTVGEGKATITAKYTTDEGETVTASYKIEVKTSVVRKLTLIGPDKVKVGETIHLDSKYEEYNPYNEPIIPIDGFIVFSSNPEIAAPVESFRLDIKGIKVGKAIITFGTNGLTATKEIEVVETYVTKELTISGPSSVEVGDTIDLIANLEIDNPDNEFVASAKSGQFKSSNEKVAAIEMSVGGKVTIRGIKAGTVTITCTWDECTATKKIKVVSAEDNNNETEIKKYSDVDYKAWYAEAINYATKNKIMNGVSEYEFLPNGNATRAMVATVLYNLENKPKTKVGYSFTDVKANDWFAEAVQWAKNNEVVSGFEDGSFRPNEYITREQLAVMLCNYMELKKEKLDNNVNSKMFNDEEKISSWALKSVKQLKKMQILNGKLDNMFDPKANTTRAEIAQVVMNMLEK